jgi:hypothetical protein
VSEHFPVETIGSQTRVHSLGLASDDVLCTVPVLLVVC